MLATCLLAITAQASADSITICSDNNFWYPFTLMKDNKSAGLHIDIINTALTNLGHTVTFRPLPWKRCLDEAEKGLVDGVATASYKDARAKFLHYPEDAASSKQGQFRVTQVEYVVVTSANNPYDFTGDVTTLPQPVMAPKGYSVVDDLQKLGVNVKSQARGDENNIKKLLRSGKGAVVTIPDVVKVLGQKPEYKGKLKISSTPLKSKSYYLPISKKSKLTAETTQSIWKEIAKIRDNEGLMAKMAAKY
jgi:polar amino acid transport system substrate-binding protein